MLITLSIIFISTLITAITLLILNYKESNKTLLLLDEQDIIIIDMQTMNESFLSDLNNELK